MPTATEPTVVTLDDALQAIRHLRLELAELRDQLTTEVRTRRLVVVDEVGNELIYTKLDREDGVPKAHGASLHVAWTDGTRSADAVLYAGDSGSSDYAGADVYVGAHGDIAGHLQSHDWSTAPNKTDTAASLSVMKHTEGRAGLEVEVTPTGIEAGLAYSSLCRSHAVFQLGATS